MTPDRAELAARLSELETRYTLLQRTVEELDAVLLAQDKRIDVLERRCALLTGQLSGLSERETEERSLEEEKPPHY